VTDVTLYANKQPAEGTLIELGDRRYRVAQSYSTKDEETYRDSSIFVEPLTPEDFKQEIASGKKPLSAQDILTESTLDNLPDLRPTPQQTLTE